MNDIFATAQDGKNKDFKITVVLKYLNIVMIVMRSMQLLCYYHASSLRMIVVNLIGITVFALSFRLLQKKSYAQYLHAFFSEALCNTAAAVIFLGWLCGFQFWFFALASIFFLPLFIDDEGSNKLAPFIPFISILSYFVLYFCFKSKLIRNFDVIQGSLFSDTLYIINSAVSLITIFIFTLLYATEARVMQNNLKVQAEYDQLTGLYNRYTMHKIIDDAINQSLSGKTSFSIAISDIDFFKKINDTYGHNAGDTVLSKLSELFLSYSAKGVEIGRWGGEEFLFICKNTVDTDKLYTIIESIRREVENLTIKSDKNTIRFTISAGISQFSIDQSFNDLIQSADNKLYLAKHNGRNQTLR